MRKKLKYFLIFLVVAMILYFFWPFGKRSFSMEKSFMVTLSDNGMEHPVVTNSQTIAEFLAERNITLGGSDFIFPDLVFQTYPGQKITIRRAIPVMIEVDDREIKIDTLGKTVREAVTEANVTLSHADKIKPELNSTLEPGLNIVVTRINFEEITIEEGVPFKTVEKEDSSVLWRKKEIKQKGEKGVREKTYKITYTNGKETNRQLLASKVAKEPVSQIEVTGTKIIVGKTDKGLATWYSNGDGMTCASLDFPFGKYLRVTNRSNGKSVIVQVNDSGPYGEDRIIDLNKKAFQKIADLGAGVINVKVEEILN